MFHSRLLFPHLFFFLFTYISLTFFDINICQLLIALPILCHWLEILLANYIKYSGRKENTSTSPTDDYFKRRTVFELVTFLVDISPDATFFCQEFKFSNLLMYTYLTKWIKCQHRNPTLISNIQNNLITIHYRCRVTSSMSLVPHLLKFEHFIHGFVCAEYTYCYRWFTLALLLFSQNFRRMALVQRDY